MYRKFESDFHWEKIHMLMPYRLQKAFYLNEI